MAFELSITAPFHFSICAMPAAGHFSMFWGRWDSGFALERQPWGRSGSGKWFEIERSPSGATLNVSAPGVLLMITKGQPVDYEALLAAE